MVEEKITNASKPLWSGKKNFMYTSILSSIWETFLQSRRIDITKEKQFKRQKCKHDSFPKQKFVINNNKKCNSWMRRGLLLLPWERTEKDCYSPCLNEDRTSQFIKIFFRRKRQIKDYLFMSVTSHILRTIYFYHSFLHYTYVVLLCIFYGNFPFILW